MKQWLLVLGAALFCLCLPDRASAQDCASTCYSGSSCTQSCTIDGSSTTCGAYTGGNCPGSCQSVCWSGAACESSCFDGSSWTTCGNMGGSACIGCGFGCGSGVSCSTQCIQGGTTLTTCGGAGQSCTAEEIASGACASGTSSVTGVAPGAGPAMSVPASLTDPAGKCRLPAPAAVVTVADLIASR